MRSRQQWPFYFKGKYHILDLKKRYMNLLFILIVNGSEYLFDYLQHMTVIQTNVPVCCTIQTCMVISVTVFIIYGELG